MSPERASKILLKYIYTQFPDGINNLPNEDYLHFQLDRLEKLRMNYHGQSVNREVLPRHRARARDLEQNCAGLIAGIKFAISFAHFRDVDLAKMEGVDTLIRNKEVEPTGETSHTTDATLDASTNV